MNVKTFLLAGLFLLLSACSFPQGLLPPTPGYPPPTETPETLPSPALTPKPTDTPLSATPSATALPPTATSAPTLTPPPTATLTAIPTLSPTPITFPTITFKTNANCRLGPFTNYNQVTNFLIDRTTTAEGRNPDSSWLWVKSASGNCWISTSTIKDPIDFSFLPIVPFLPLPEAPSRLTVAEIVCTGRTSITLRWPDVSGETGYRIYRNGIRLTEIKADATEYIDFPPLAADYLYEIESFNNVGVSVRYTQRVQGCKK